MNDIEKAVEKAYTMVGEPLEEDGMRLVLVVRDWIVFIEDYKSASVWDSAERVMAANKHVTTREEWIKSIYAHVTNLLNSPEDFQKRMTLIQEVMILVLVAWFYEPPVVEKDNVNVVMLLVEPPPGETASRFYIEDASLCADRIRLFLERRGASVH